jgi:hypothetical protein
MGILKPQACVFNVESLTSTLTFPDETGDEYWLRGGITWPLAVEMRDKAMPGLVKRKVAGYAVLCGVNLRTERITVFEHGEFNGVELILKDMKPLNKPLVPFMLNAWAKYHALDWYWHEAEGTNRQFRAGLERAEGLIPKPAMLYVPWDDEAAAEHLFWYSANAGLLEIPPELYEQIKQGEDLKVCPAKHALVCALMGMQRHAYQKPLVEREWD